MASTTPDLRLPSLSQDIAAGDWYQIVLLDDRGTCVWTTCLRSLPDSGTAGSWTRDLSRRKPTPCPLYHHATQNAQNARREWPKLEAKGPRAGSGFLGRRLGAVSHGFTCILCTYNFWHLNSSFIFLSTCYKITRCLKNVPWDFSVRNPMWSTRYPCDVHFMRRLVIYMYNARLEFTSVWSVMIHPRCGAAVEKNACVSDSSCLSFTYGRPMVSHWGRYRQRAVWTFLLATYVRIAPFYCDSQRTPHAIQLIQEDLLPCAEGPRDVL